MPVLHPKLHRSWCCATTKHFSHSLQQTCSSPKRSAWLGATTILKIWREKEFVTIAKVASSTKCSVGSKDYYPSRSKSSQQHYPCWSTPVGVRSTTQGGNGLFLLFSGILGTEAFQLAFDVLNKDMQLQSQLHKSCSLKSFPTHTTVCHLNHEAASFTFAKRQSGSFTCRYFCMFASNWRLLFQLKTAGTVPVRMVSTF